jgi:cell division protein FtsI/penicillin-binding protein 2
MMRQKISNSNDAPNSYNLRIFLLMGLIGLFIAFLTLRLFNLQVTNHALYLAKAADQHGEESTIPSKRGEIYLAGGENKPMLVATNIAQSLVFSVGREMSNDEKILASQKLSPILGIDTAELLLKMNEGNQNYLPLKHQLSDEDAEKIKGLNLSGIHLEPETVRFYPQTHLASQVLGFLGYQGSQRVGQYGVEGTYEKELAGVPGVLAAEAGATGTWISFGGKKEIPAVDGDDIYLTVDPSIQFKSQQVLEKTVKDHGADSGSVTVVDPKTGKILAMASYPDFDPNQYGKVENPAYYNNTPLSSDYEPGSTFKAITMAAGIAAGVISPQSTFVDTGSIQVDDRVIKNSDPTPRGVQTMTQVLDESLNTGAVYVQQLLGRDKYLDYVKKFGFGKKTGIDLIGETSGNLKQLDQRGNIFYANASFGQGILTTPIQMIQFYTAIANGGKMMQPYIVDHKVHADGRIEKTEPKMLGEVLDVKSASTVSAMLVDVVENGHGKRAAVKGYFIGGKTGTAQVAYPDRSGYDPDKNIGSFIGFGPANEPKFLMLVRIDNPRDVKFAESTAAPAFGEIASFILNYLQVPPTR